MKKCRWCGSEFVCWDWFYSPFWKTWTYNLFGGVRSAWRNPKIYLERWGHECWGCGRCQTTFFKVSSRGISYENLKAKFVFSDKHEFQEGINEVCYLFTDGYKMWSKGTVAKRLNHALSDISRLIKKRCDTNTDRPMVDVLVEEWEKEKSAELPQNP